MISYTDFYSEANTAPFPALNKLLSQNRGRYRHYLNELLGDISSNGRYGHGYASQRHLKEISGKTAESWNRRINFFCLLGVIRKEPIQNWRKYERHANLYRISRRTTATLRKANERAQIILESRLTCSGMSKAAVINLFGQAEADAIYLDERGKGNLQTITENEIVKALREQAQARGYATNAEIIDRVRSITGQSKADVERRFQAYKPAILAEYIYKRTTKEEAKKYDVPSGRFIIYPKPI